MFPRFSGLTMKNREGGAGRSGPELENPRLRFQTTSGRVKTPTEIPRSGSKQSYLGREKKERERIDGRVGEPVGLGRVVGPPDRRSQDACMKDLFCVRALPLRALITQ